MLLVRLAVRVGKRVVCDNERYYGASDYTQAFSLPVAALACHGQASDGKLAVEVTNGGR